MQLRLKVLQNKRTKEIVVSKKENVNVSQVFKSSETKPEFKELSYLPKKDRIVLYSDLSEVEKSLAKNIAEKTKIGYIHVGNKTEKIIYMNDLFIVVEK